MRSKSTRKCPDCGGPIASRSKAVLRCPACAKRVTAVKLTTQGEGPNPSGLCMCGCGGKTAPARQSNSRTGDVRGTPQRFIRGHQGVGRSKPGPLYLVQDCGYTTPCWVWQRKCTHGYAYINIDGKTARAARVFYEQHVGPIPDGLTIDHLCRNRACVNPDHLEAVSLTENIRRKPSTKLTIEIAREIRRLAESMSQTTISDRFGLSSGMVSRIVHNHIWRE